MYCYCYLFTAKTNVYWNVVSAAVLKLYFLAELNELKPCFYGYISTKTITTDICSALPTIRIQARYTVINYVLLV